MTVTAKRRLMNLKSAEQRVAQSGRGLREALRIHQQWELQALFGAANECLFVLDYNLRLRRGYLCG